MSENNTNTSQDTNQEQRKHIIDIGAEVHPLITIVAAAAVILIILFIGFRMGKKSEQAAEQALREQTVRHVLDSLKQAYASTEKSKDSVQTQIVTQTNTIIQHERSVAVQAAVIKAMPFTLIGPDLKARLESAQVKPWLVDTQALKR